MENNLTDFKTIKGFLCHEEGLFLYKLAKINCSKSFSVEIGSYCGKSACYIAEACKENKTYLISIDHHKGSEEQQFGEEYFDGQIGMRIMQRPQGKSVFKDENGDFDKAAMDKFMDRIYIENVWCFSKDKNRDIFKYTKLGTLEEFI